MSKEVEEIKEKDIWGYHDEFTRDDWKYDVTCDYTQLGYWDWVEAKLEQNENETEEDYY